MKNCKINICLAVLAWAGTALADSATAIRQLAQHLARPVSKRPPLAKQEFARTPLTEAGAAKAQQLLWEDHTARLRATRAAEMKAKVIKLGGHAMRFEFFVYGKKPKGGRSLFISMHGGGNAPARVNDSQWENQKRLYRPATRSHTMTPPRCGIYTGRTIWFMKT